MAKTADNAFFVGLGMIGLAGAAAVIAATPWGIGLSPDSAAYIGGARSLIEGMGFSLPTDSGTFAPIIHFPPLYSLLLGAAAIAGADPLSAARWFAALLFAGNVVLAGILGFSVSGSRPFSLLIALFASAAIPMVQTHTMAWSEPVYISLQLGGLIFLILFLKNGCFRSLIFAAVIFGCAVLARYVGLTLIMAGVASVLLLTKKGWRDRVKDAIIFGATGLLPFAAWLLRNEWTAESVVNRKFSFHPMSLEQLGALFKVFVSWFSFARPVSFDLASLLLVVLALLGAACVYRETFPRVPFERPPVPRFSAHIPLLAVVVLSYLLALFGSMSFLDAHVPVDSRLLSPLYVPLVILGLSLGAKLWRDCRLSGFPRWLMALCLAVALPAQASTSFDWLEFSSRYGVGYAGREWRNSETLAKLGALGGASSTYSNAPDVLYVLRGTPAAMIPRKVDPHTLRPNEHFMAEMNQLARRVREGQVALVFLRRVDWRWYLPTAEEIEQSMGTDLAVRTHDGLILKAR